MASASPKVRVLITDDHPVVAEGVKRYLSPHDGLHVEGTVGSVEALFAALRAAEKIDVVLLDVQVPGMEGPSTVRALRDLGPKIVLFTHLHPDEYVARLVGAGASGFVSKSDPVTAVVDAIFAVHRGGEWLDDSLKSLADRSRHMRAPHEALTEREQAVFALLLDGKTPKEIGFELTLAASTVYSHIENVRTKLGASSTLDLHRYADQWGLLRNPRR